MIFNMQGIVLLALLLLQIADAFTSHSLRHVAQSIQSNIQATIPKFHISSLFRMTATEAPPRVDTMVGGMFTNSSPETKRVIPTNMEGKTKFKIVYVVLESQYQSALTKACNSINEGKEGVAVEAVGYLLEELRNPNVFEQFKADIADANIFIGSLIFVQELADKVFYILHIRFACTLASKLSQNIISYNILSLYRLLK
jgi:hypothetical protein